MEIKWHFESVRTEDRGRSRYVAVYRDIVFIFIDVQRCTLHSLLNTYLQFFVFNFYRRLLSVTILRLARIDNETYQVLLCTHRHHHEIMIGWC